jgi:Na+-driven multidrug efflux pump
MSIQLFIGFTSAAAILISTRLGAQDFQAAKQAAWLLGALITLAAMVYGVILAWCYRPILALYTPNSPQIMQAAPYIIWVIAATLWLRLYNVVACVSILRSGGEGKFTLYVDLVVIWLIVLPLTAACGLLWHWPIQWVFALAITAEALIKAPLYSLRIQTKQWLTSLVQSKKEG